MNRDLYEDQDSEEWCPLKTASLMKRLVIQKCYNKDDQTCAICLEPMYQRMCEYLPCTHVFHFPCLGQLIEKRIYTCPLCRYDFKDTLALAGIQVDEPPLHNFTFTLYTNIDMYDFFLELLWRSYQIDATTEVDDDHDEDDDDDYEDYDDDEDAVL
jgi:hypothetical protein